MCSHHTLPSQREQRDPFDWQSSLLLRVSCFWRRLLEWKKGIELFGRKILKRWFNLDFHFIPLCVTDLTHNLLHATEWSWHLNVCTAPIPRWNIPYSSMIRRDPVLFAAYFLPQFSNVQIVMILTINPPVCTVLGPWMAERLSNPNAERINN